MPAGLIGPLGGVAGLALLCLAVAAARDPVARRLAGRQFARRRTEALLVTTGALLGTATLVGALAVGDTLTAAVRDIAYRTLGPVDERIVTSAGPSADALAAALRPLANSRDIDGVVSGLSAEAAASRDTGDTTTAEPRALAWEFDFATATTFGGRGQSGLSGQPPGPGAVVLNAPMAQTLHASPGDMVTLSVFGRPLLLQVQRVVPERGLAGVGFGETQNSDAFLAAGTLTAAAHAAGTAPRSVTFISNRGDLAAGNQLTPLVTDRLRSLTAGLASKVAVATPKRDVLATAARAGAVVTALFLLVGSFSAIAGVLLLINVVVMLGEERKPALGLMRAVGMKRSRLVLSLTLETTGYALMAAAAGAAVGMGVGWGTVLLADQVFRGWSMGSYGVRLSYTVTAPSLVLGALGGLLVAMVTGLGTSVRISRLPIVAALRGLAPRVPRRPGRRAAVGSVVAAAALAVLAAPAVATGNPVGSYLLPAAALTALVPAARRVLPRRGAHSILAAGVLAATLAVGVMRPQTSASLATAAYVLVGCLLTLSAVVLVSENQQILLRPLRMLVARSRTGGLATRLAVGYPLAQRFRTGATVLMIALIVFTLVLVSEVDTIIATGTTRAVAHATADFGLRVDYNPAVGIADPVETLQSGTFRGRVTKVLPVRSAYGQVQGTGGGPDGGGQPIDAMVVGVPTGMAMPFSARMPQFGTDTAVWEALQTDSRYVVLDGYFGAQDAIPAARFPAGSTLTLRAAGSGRTEEKIVAGVLESGVPFYAATSGLVGAFPLVMADSALGAQFAGAARVASALLQTAPGVDPDRIAAELQGTYLAANLVATPIATSMRQRMAAETGFLRLMQGFLCLGLVVGISGLGVVMVRAVQERRRTLGMLRALGVRRSTVARSFLLESTFLVVEGTAVGTSLAVLTAWLLYRNSPLLDGLRAGFTVPWGAIATLSAVLLGATLLATRGSAVRAGRTPPAQALRALD